MTYPGPGGQGVPPPPPVPVYRTPEPLRGSIVSRAIVIIVIGVFLGGLPAIFGIIALVQVDTDPVSAQNMLRWGKITLIVVGSIIALFVLLYIGFMVLMLVLGIGLPLLLGASTSAIVL